MRRSAGPVAWPASVAAVALLAAAAFPGTVAAEAVRYRVDPQHTFPSPAFPHMGISIWRGKFTRSSGAITLDRAAETGSVDIAIDPASIRFGLDIMDEKARSAEWFDVERYPEARYKGDIVFEGGQPARVDGAVTFRGITREVPLTITLFNCIPHPMLKVEVCGADATGTMNWSEYGMQHSAYGEGEAGVVTVRIQVEAIRQE